jgi:hypothetical protein
MESTKDNQKPCIECGKECSIFPIELGDSFTLTYLRVCGTECLFRITYDYLYSICHHKDFRNHLYDLQNAEDRALRDEFIDVTTKMALEEFRKHPQLLSTPIATAVFDMFKDAPQLPDVGGVCRFVRPTKEEKIQWAKRHVNQLTADLLLAQKDLEDLEGMNRD